MKNSLGFFLSLMASVSLIFIPHSAQASQLELIRSSMKDLGLTSNKQRPKISAVYAAAREDLRPKAQKWLDPVVESLKNYPVFEMTSKVVKNRENEEVFRFVIKDPSGDITMDITPTSETQPIKINGVPMPTAAWWAERDFELFLDNVILDGELEASHPGLEKLKIFVQLFLGARASAAEADDLWLEVTARACLAIANTADPLCDKLEGTLEIFSKAEPKQVSDKLAEAKRNILSERTSDPKEQKRLNGLIKDRLAKLEKSLQKTAKLPEKKVASSEVKPMDTAVSVVASPSPAPKAVSVKKESAKKSPVKAAKAPAAAKPTKKVSQNGTPPKVIALDFAEFDDDLEESEAEIAAGQKHQISARELASLTALAGEGEMEADSAAKVPAPVVEVQPQADDKSKSFSERRKVMSAQKVGLAIATVTGMALVTKTISKKAKMQKLAAPSPSDNSPSVRLTREPASRKSIAKEPVDSGDIKVNQEKPTLTPEQLMTPVKPRKSRGSN